MTDTNSAATAVQTLLNKQKELLVAIAVTDETLAEYRRDLAEVRAQLRGVQLGQQLAQEAAREDADG